MMYQGGSVIIPRSAKKVEDRLRVLTDALDTAVAAIDTRVTTLEGSGGGTVTSVNITAPAAGITVSGEPITTSGAITLALANDLAAVEALASTGIARRTGPSAWSVGTAVAVSEVVDALKTGTIGATFDGNGAVIAVSSVVFVRAPYACTITEATALADQTGSAVVDVWKDTYANYQPTNADSITAAAPITITASVKSTDTTLTGWTTSVAAGDVIAFSVDSCSTIRWLQIQLKVVKT